MPNRPSRDDSAQANPVIDGLSRRSTLGLITGTLLSASGYSPSAAAQATTFKNITIVYRREAGSQAGPLRGDAVVQEAMRTLQDAFGRRGFRVLQPQPAVLALLDRSSDVVLDFDPDAGFSMVLSLYQNVRPREASDLGVAEVRLSASVLYGPSIALTDTSRGQRLMDLSPSNRDFATRHGVEVAAKAASEDLAERVARRLHALTTEELAQFAQPVPRVLPDGRVVVDSPAFAPPTSKRTPNDTGPLPRPKRRFALVVGIGDYAAVRKRLPQWTLDNLGGVKKDVANTVETLKKIGFEDGQIKVLAEAQATSSAVRGELMRLAGAVGPEDLVVVTIASHGAPKDMGVSGYGLPLLADYQGKDDPNALDFWQIQGLVGNLPAASVVLMVDTCHAGGAAKTMVSASVGSDGVRINRGSYGPQPQKMTRTVGDKNYAVIAAAQSEEESLEVPNVGGLFTSRMLKALQQERQVALEQVFNKVFPDVVRESRAICKAEGGCVVQTPVFAFAGRGNEISI